MTKGDWLDLTVLERKKYNLLTEAMDLTRQLGEALDRNDDVSLRMLISMRQEPILQLEEVKKAAALRREGLSPEELERVSALAAGASPREGEEGAYFEEAGRCRRLLERLLELDRRLSLRLAGENSFYAAEP